jgi:arylsulfatase
LPEGQPPVAAELWTSQLPVACHQTTWVAEQTMAFITGRGSAPFFAWCSFVDPHHPFNAPRAYRDRYAAASLDAPVWEEGELAHRSSYHRARHTRETGPMFTQWREYRAQYYGMITLMDEQIGRLMRHLEAAGIADETVVIFTADHGELLGDHGLFRKGLFHYEPLIRVPCLMHCPARLAAGRRHGGIVQSVDIPATILDLAGLAAPPQYQGRSLAPWCRGERDDPSRSYALITNGGEGPHYEPWPELRTVVTERWKLHYYVNEGHLEIDDLHNDPQERHPLAVEQHPALVRELLERLVDAGSMASTWGVHIGRW